MYHTLEPLHVCNVWDLDTGAGWSGKLTIMDIETKEYWQSVLTASLYGGTPGRESNQFKPLF
jgi:serine/threonine protein phosphatase 1